MDTDVRPTLLSSCALAATAEEAGFRVDYPNSATRSSRIFALDPAAAEIMYQIVEDPWKGAHFLTVRDGNTVDPEKTGIDDLALSHPNGVAATLSKEIEGADVVVLIATTGDGVGSAEVIAREAYHRKIMTVGLAMSESKEQHETDAVVNSLRRFASVLVVARDASFVPAMLTALRA